MPPQHADFHDLSKSSMAGRATPTPSSPLTVASMIGACAPSSRCPPPPLSAARISPGECVCRRAHSPGCALPARRRRRACEGRSVRVRLSRGRHSVRRRCSSPNPRRGPGLRAVRSGGLQGRQLASQRWRRPAVDRLPPHLCTKQRRCRLKARYHLVGLSWARSRTIRAGRGSVTRIVGHSASTCAIEDASLGRHSAPGRGRILSVCVHHASV
jgi:hypothetical protein